MYGRGHRRGRRTAVIAVVVTGLLALTSWVSAVAVAGASAATEPPSSAARGSNAPRGMVTLQTAAFGARRAHARRGVPVLARAAVSRSLGRDERSYWARPDRDGFLLDDHGQGLKTRLGSDCVSVRTGSERLDAELRAYGYGSELVPVARARPSADANRVRLRFYGLHLSRQRASRNGPSG